MPTNLYPNISALPSGLDVTQQATGTMKGWLDQIQKLFNTSNQGRNFYSAYDMPSWGDPAYRKEMAIRRQYLADDTTKNALNYARQARNLSQMRGGYGVRGTGGSAADILGAAYAATQASRQAQLQQLYDAYRSEQEAARAGAVQGFQGLLGGIGTGLVAYNTAAANQAQAAYQAAQNQLAQQQNMLQWYNATKSNVPTPQERRAADPYGYAHKAALQAAMDKEAAAQDLYRAQVEASMGVLQGNRLTDAGRGAQFAAQKAYEDALIAAGIATPVQRKQDMNQVLGYGTGGGPPQSATMNAAKEGYYY